MDDTNIIHDKLKKAIEEFLEACAEESEQLQELIDKEEENDEVNEEKIDRLSTQKEELDAAYSAVDEITR